MAGPSSSASVNQRLSQVSLSDSPQFDPAAAASSKVDQAPTTASKKKKKKKKSTANKQDEDDDDAILDRAAAANRAAQGAKAPPPPPPYAPKQTSSLCISRNKHWRHISAYHGPWLQLPVELLESLLALNLDPLSLAPLPSSNRSPSSYPPPSTALTHAASQTSSPNSPYGLPPSMPLSKLLGTGKEKAQAPTPPPIDPGVFRSIINIRRLVDEASDLAIRASSGLTAFNLSTLSAASLAAIEPPRGENGRAASMSATRMHRLRVLACQRLAEAYKWDEVACSVMVMQGATALDDLADKVLKVDPENIDALYVNFFHEKIPSRMVAENTSTAILDHLIALQPHRLEFYRTRGIVKVFLDQFQSAAKDFTYALLESRAERKKRAKAGKKKKKASSAAQGKGKGREGSPGSHGGSTPTVEDDSSELVVHRPSSPYTHSTTDDRPQHPSARPEAPLPMEPQCLFLRASSYFTHAIWLIEGAALGIEGVRRNGTNDGVEVRLCNIPGGRFGGIENGHKEGPLGSKQGEKFRLYYEEYSQPKWKTDVHALARKSIRDHERFVAHFDQMESTCIHAPEPTDPSRPAITNGDTPPQITNGTSDLSSAPPTCNDPNGKHAGHSHTQTFTTYHPLLVESHYCILLCYLLLGDIAGASEAYAKTTHLVDGVEGYPVFLPARSMAQAEFLEIFERLATWRYAFGPRINQKAILPSSPVAPTVAAPPTIVEPAVANLNPILSHPTHLAPSSSSLTSFHNGTNGGSSSSSSGAGPSYAPSLASSYVPEAGGSSSASASGSGRQTPVSFASGSTAHDGALPSSSSPTQTEFAESAPPPAPEPVLLPPLDEPLRHLEASRTMVIRALAKAKERRQRQAEKVADAKRRGKNTSFSAINIPLSGPRVEIMLVWMAAVVLPELEAANGLP